MTLIPLEIPPGVFKNGTDMMAKDRWTDSNLVRWHEDSLRPVGGWRVFDETSIMTVIRGMIGWRDNAGLRYIAAGSYNALNVIETNGTVSDITPVGLVDGFESAKINTGYGGDVYGAGTYGTPRDDASEYSEASCWTLDTWGEHLVACSSADGKLYEWKLDPATPAEVIPNAPIDCQTVAVSDERFMFALGADGNPRLVRWSDRENNEEWTPTATNQAGDIELQTSGGILQALRTRGQMLILTDMDAHTATFVGGTAVYSFEEVGLACGAASRMTAVATKGVVYWMGLRGFYRFSGGSVEGLKSEVSDHVFTNLNRDQISQCWGVSNNQYGEVWWFYPSEGSTEVDSYVIYNYREDHWSLGVLSRTAGFDQGAWRYPMMAEAAGAIYEHEFGFNHGDQQAYAETGPIMLGTGDQVVHVNSLLPDEETQGQVTAVFKTRFYPNAEERDYGPFNMAAPTDVRFTGRQFRMRVIGNGNSDWRVGIMRVDTMVGGKR